MNSTNRSTERNKKVVEKAYQILNGNRMQIGKHRFITPSKIIDEVVDYEGKQWLWDSCFHAMVMAYRDPDMAKDEILALFSYQREDGFIPHMNYFRGDAQKLSSYQKKVLEEYVNTSEGMEIPKEERDKFKTTLWTSKTHSDITQPPIIAQATELVYKVTSDKKFLQKAIENLKRYYDYLTLKRDPDRDHLVSIIHQWESGWDNSQRWDEVLGVSSNDVDHLNYRKMLVFARNKKAHWNLEEIFKNDWFNVEAVDFNVLYCLNLESLSRLCQEIGKKEDAQKYSNLAQSTKNAIFTKMWDGDKYVDLIGKEEKKSSVKSAAMFFPMMLDGEPHGKHLIDKHLTNPHEFNLKYGIPTTSADHPLFKGDQYWRGNVWINVNYFVWLGLKKFLSKNPNYAPAKEMADKIKEATFSLLDKTGFFEYFHPEKGEGYGAKSFGWNGIVMFMMEE